MDGPTMKQSQRLLSGATFFYFENASLSALNVVPKCRNFNLYLNRVIFYMQPETICTVKLRNVTLTFRQISPIFSIFKMLSSIGCTSLKKIFRINFDCLELNEQFFELPQLYEHLHYVNKENILTNSWSKINIIADILHSTLKYIDLKEGYGKFY